MDTAAEGPELRDYADLLRRRWAALACGAALGLAAAGAALIAVPSSYSSTTAVQVRPTGIADLTGEDSGRTNGEVNLDTEAQVVKSTRVAEAAADLLGTSEAPVDLRERIDITVPPNSSVLEIAYRAGSAEAAQEGSAAFAEAYLQFRADRVGAQIDGRLEALQEEADDRYTELEELAGSSAGGPGAPRMRAESRLETVQDEIADLNGEIAPLSALRSSISAGQVITPAGLPESPVTPKAALWLGGGLMLGLAAGLGAAFAAEHRDRRLRSVRDVRRLLGAPVLLELRTGGLHGSGDREGQHANEAAHALGATLGDGRRVLLVTGAAPGDAAGAAAADLAVALGRTGSDVLLVLADPEDAGTPRLLGLPEDAPGLSEALTGGAGTPAPEYGAHGIRVLPFGGPGADALLQRSAMTGLLSGLEADRVVVAAAPMCERADAHALAAAADAVLPVVALERGRCGAVAEELAGLERVGAHVPGVIVTPAGGERVAPRRAPGCDAAGEAAPETAEQDGAQENTGQQDTDSDLTLQH